MFMLTLRSEEYSPRTLHDYEYRVESLVEFLDDPPFLDITTFDIRKWLVWLRDEYKSPRGHALTAKTVYNYWTAMRSFFRWAQEDGLIEENPSLAVKAPRWQDNRPDPFTQEEVKLLADAALSGGWDQLRRRNRAIIVVLVDTGVRASELLSLDLCDLDLKRDRLWVVGKGNKGRHVPFSFTAKRWILRYLVDRGDDPGPLFLSFRNDTITYSALRSLIGRLGEEAGVHDARAHRFRHTFAVNFLRNGGNALALRSILGHTTLDMVNRYVRLAERDIEELHRTASPADHMNL
jgi:integrase/recombinase XerD